MHVGNNRLSFYLRTQNVLFNLKNFSTDVFSKRGNTFYERNVHGKIAEMQKSSSSSLPSLLCPARKNTLTSSWLPSWNGLVTSTRCLQGKSKVNISLQGREPHHHNPRWAKEAGGKPCAGSWAAGLAKGSERVWRCCADCLGVLLSRILPPGD